jgi:hypothetical protein
MGVPYPIEFVPSIMAVNEFPTNRFDPDKPMRAAAFAGWAMASAISLPDLSDLVGRVKEQFEARKLWAIIGGDYR